MNLRQNLKENGLDPRELPLVIQFNKRDMPDVRSDEEIDASRKRGKEPVFKAIAMRGNGVIETFMGLLELTWRKLEREHQLCEKFGIDGSRPSSPNVRERLGVERGSGAMTRTERNERNRHRRSADIGRLEEVVDREALGEVCRSFFDLFGLPIRVFSEDGALLATSTRRARSARYVNTLPAGRVACARIVGEREARRSRRTTASCTVLHRRGLPHRADPLPGAPRSVAS